MKFRFTVCYLVLLLSGTVYADFHIWSRIQHASCLEEDCEAVIVDDLVACPTSRANCGCWGKGGSAGYVLDWEELGLPPSGYFRIGSGFCGQSLPLDFYRQSNGQWIFYTQGGQGGVKGNCWVEGDTSSHSCGTGFLTTATVKKALYCQTSFCS